MTRLFPLLFCGVLLSLASCAPPLSNNGNKQKEIEDRQALVDLYQPLVGTYQGVVANRPDRSDGFQIEMKIFLVDEQNGVNEDGEVRFRPVLRARYRRLDFPQDGIGERTLILRYYRETGEIAGATSPTSAPAGNVADSNYLSMSGKVIDGEALVEIRDHRGVVGTVRLVRF